MNILLLQPASNWYHPYAEAPSRALLILGTIAEKQRHKVKILHLDIEQTPLPDHIIDFQPDIIGITVNTFQVKSARNIVKLIRQIKPETKIIIGGPHAIVWGEEQKDWSPSDRVDEIVIGEGEEVWLGIVGGDNSVVSINYDLVDLKKFVGIDPIGASPSMAIMASRGCPYNCTYCNTPIFWGKKVRYRNPIDVVFEINLLHHGYGIKEIFFQDDTFNINHEWAFEIFNRIIDNGLHKKMLFKLACRVNEKLITKEFLDLAYKAGVWNIFFGVESGSQEMLDRMNKGITIPEIKRAFEMTHQAHINTQASFIVGLPGENWSTLAETDRLIREIKPTRFGWCFFCPFPHTEATRQVVEAGHRKDVDYGEYSYGKVLARTEALDYDDLANFRGFCR